jgi:outer membrane lipoprotein
MGDRSLSPSEAAVQSALPTRVLEWGGVIVDTHNLAQRTELQVIGYPLGRSGRPDLDATPVGRFITVSPGFLEPEEYRRGRQITLSGRIAGIRQGSVGEADYLFPVIESDEIHLWPLEGASSGRTSIHFGIGTGFGVGSQGSIGIGLGF